MHLTRASLSCSVRGFAAAATLMMAAFGLTAAPAASLAVPTSQVLAVATADAKAQLHKPVRLGAAKVNTSGEWAFVSATLQASDGGRFSYAGTPFAEAAANGGKSNRYVGLFRKARTGWARVDSAAGPTDVAWAPWAAKYGAPPSIFRI